MFQHTVAQKYFSQKTTGQNKRMRSHPRAAVEKVSEAASSLGQRAVSGFRGPLLQSLHDRAVLAQMGICPTAHSLSLSYC